MSARILVGDARTVLPTLADGSVRCCVTSPPYWGLRDYGHAGQLGLERTPEEYVANLVAVFQGVRRVLADNGTLWLNLGDSYVGANNTSIGGNANFGSQPGRKDIGKTAKAAWCGLDAKNLVGIPWRVAFALQADGWYLRSDIIWAKPNPMPESVTDRPTKAHEYVFLLSKRERYYYDLEAIREEPKPDHDGWMRAPKCGPGRPAYSSLSDKSGNITVKRYSEIKGANSRTVWTIATQPYPGAHFATFPEELARRCLLAGSAPGDIVLDPFAGSGTVGQVATGNGRGAILIELNPEYAELARDRIGRMLCE